jgi:hypothetical protein
MMMLQCYPLVYLLQYKALIGHDDVAMQVQINVLPCCVPFAVQGSEFT